MVALSRVRGLKRDGRGGKYPPSGRTLTSAWIETIKSLAATRTWKSRTLTSAWIETPSSVIQSLMNRVALSRVRGLKLKTAFLLQVASKVALSRVRGLKPVDMIRYVCMDSSHSHECVD